MKRVLRLIIASAMAATLMAATVAAAEAESGVDNGLGMGSLGDVQAVIDSCNEELANSPHFSDKYLVGSDAEYTPPADYEWPEMTIVMNDYNVANSGPALCTQLAADYIEEVSGGKIKCETYYGGTLMESTDSFAGTVDGLADITYYLYTLNSGVSVVHNLFTAYYVREMPGMLGMLDIINNTLDSVPEIRQEFIDQGLYELVSVPTSGSRFEFKDAELAASIKTPDDLKGHIIQSSGYNTPAWANHGVSGMAMPPSEWYSNLDRGVVDALTMNLPGVRDFGLADVSNGYVAFGNSGGLYHSCGAYFANYEKWMSWPEEVQDLVRAAFRKGGRFNCERDVAATEEFALSEQEAGKVINRIVEADMQPWYDLGQESLELWKADVEEMGLDAQAILDGYLAQVDEYFATHEQ